MKYKLCQELGKYSIRYNDNMKKLKIALIHDYLTQYGGAEKTLEAIIELFPDAPIFTGVYEPSKLPKAITDQKIIYPTSTVLTKFPKYFTFLMPLVFEGFDLSEFDIIISDGTAWPKGVITKPQQLHISYIHTPPRFLYKYSVESQKRFKWYFKPIIPILDHFLRIWDFSAAQRPDYLLTNSKETQKRIQKFYRRNATILYPPVETNVKISAPKNNLKPTQYVALGRLVAYKNFELIIQAFNILKLPLTIVGSGSELKKLKKIAGSSITFTGYVSKEEKHSILENCLGFIFPTVDEDLGIVAIEAMAHGKPVLAHKSGGPLETVQDGITGMFFEKATVENFISAMKEFDKNVRNGIYDDQKIKKSVQSFEKARFKEDLNTFIWEKWEKHVHTINNTHQL